MGEREGGKKGGEVDLGNHGKLIEGIRRRMGHREGVVDLLSSKNLAQS